MATAEVSPNLYLIDLDQKLTGFRNFIASWLYKGENTTLLVDPGPRYSIETLLTEIELLGVTKIDYILLTHIHIDHAGAAGRVIREYPTARIICHPKGIPHLVDPDKLWQGSLKVLGEVAEAYGEIFSVPERVFDYAPRFETEEGTITVYDTPGHAVHHLSFSFRDYLFAGEVGGIINQTPKGLYARPATPPKFIYEISAASLNKMIDLQPVNVCFGHYGMTQKGTTALIDAREQLSLWLEKVGIELKKGEEGIRDRLFKVLLEVDPLFSRFHDLEKDIQQREEHFFGNSIKGMMDYLKNRS